MGKRLFIKTGGDIIDALLKSMFIKNGVTNPAFREGDLIKNAVGVSYPILRENTPSLGIRAAGANMTMIYSFNNTLKSNPNVVIMGSSHSISFGLSGAQTLQFKLQAYFNANWGGATITNIGVAGEYSNHWLPTAQGGLSDRNIDAALSYNPDIIILIGPTNDAVQNTPPQATANLVIIRDYARQHGAYILIHSPLPRGDYNVTDQQDLADENVLWKAAFPYSNIDLFDSDLRDKTSGTPGFPNFTYFQADHIHLNDVGTTYQASGIPTSIIPTLERELRANTAYKQFEIEVSANGTTSWALFDTITNQQTIKKTYTKAVGYYRMRERLKDDSYTPYSNIIQVTNITPTANAGSDQSLASGTITTNVTGSGTDPDGTIASYLWSVISGAGLSLVNANTTTVTVNGLANGLSYTLRLTVTDNNGATGTDDMVISVGTAGNVSPTANAGADQELNIGSTTVSLTGSGTDPDGTITGYAWSLVSGPNTPSITTPSAQNTGVTGLIGGVYVFRLTVTDNIGATGNDDVRVRVVSKIMRVILSKTAATTVPAGWLNLAADPVAGAPTITDTGVSNFIFRSRGEANFNHSIGPSNAQNDWGQSVDLGSGFFSGWPNTALANYWYNPFDNFVAGKYQTEFAGLDPTKDGRLKAISSRSNANSATGPFSTRYNVNWLAGNVQLDITVTFQNTINGITSLGRPLADGTLPVAFNIGATGSVAHLNAITYEQF